MHPAAHFLCSCHFGADHLGADHPGANNRTRVFGADKLCADVGPQLQSPDIAADLLRAIVSPEHQSP